MRLFSSTAEQRRQEELADIQEERKYLLSAKDDFFLQEAYKTLRTNVMFSLTGESDSKIITITSSNQSEGKSITATNLALSFVAADKRTLLIDCEAQYPGGPLQRAHGAEAPVPGGPALPEYGTESDPGGEYPPQPL